MKRIFRIFVSAGLIAFLFTFVADAGTVWSLIKSLDPGYAFVAVLVFTLDRALMAYKWRLLLLARGYGMPLVDAVMMYCTAMTLGAALPSTVGTDVIRGLLAGRHGIPASEIAASIIAERLLGFLLAMVLALLSLYALRYTGMLPSQYEGLFITAAFGLAAAIALTLIVIDARAIEWLYARATQRLERAALLRFADRLLAAFRAVTGGRAVVVKFCVLTFIEQLFPVLFTWTVAMGIGTDSNALVLLAAVPLSILVSRLPISLDGIGVFEGIFAGLLALAGVPPEQAIAISLVGRVLQLAACLPWVLAYGLRFGFNPATGSTPRGSADADRAPRPNAAR